ncbi:uncharacterized protein [Haliotis asinina]|uniref:uncharacterized protein n=1 Tax=Haliotis asinina TaxID=109174 RepID=UPI0035324866
MAYQVRRWHKEGKGVVDLIEEYIVELKKISINNANKRQMANGLGILGSVLILAGLVLAPFTGGASAAAVAVAGSGLATIGGIAHTAVNIFQKTKENSRAKEIRSRLKRFGEETTALIRARYTKKMPEDDKWLKSMLKTETSLIRGAIPFAESPFAAGTAGAYSKALQEKPPVSYFEVDEKAVLEIFGREVKSTNFYGMIGVVAALASVQSIVLHIEQIVDDQRIIDDEANSAFVEKLCFLKHTMERKLELGLKGIDQ